MGNKYPLWLFRALPSLNSLLFGGIVSNLSSCPHWNFSMKNSSMWEIKWWSRAFGNKDLLNSKLQLNNVSITSIHLVWRFVYSTRKASMMHPINTWQLSSTSMYNDVIPWNGESLRAFSFLHCILFTLLFFPNYMRYRYRYITETASRFVWSLSLIKPNYICICIHLDCMSDENENFNLRLFKWQARNSSTDDTDNPYYYIVKSNVQTTKLFVQLKSFLNRENPIIRG